MKNSSHCLKENLCTNGIINKNGTLWFPQLTNSYQIMVHTEEKMKTVNYAENDLNRKRPRTNICLQTYTCRHSTERDIQICVLSSSSLVGSGVMWARLRIFWDHLRGEKKRELNTNENTGGSNPMHCVNYKTAYAVTLVFCIKLMIGEILIRDQLILSWNRAIVSPLSLIVKWKVKKITKKRTDMQLTNYWYIWKLSLRIY